MPRHIGTCFRFYTQMRVEKKTKHLHIEFVVTSHNSVFWLLSHGKKKNKTLENTSQRYLSVNSVKGSDIEIINTISLTYFLRLVKTSVKKITELISYLTFWIWKLGKVHLQFLRKQNVALDINSSCQPLKNLFSILLHVWTMALKSKSDRRI